MRFKKWLDFNETATSTCDVAGFRLPLLKKPIRRILKFDEGSNYSFSCVMADFSSKDTKEIVSWIKKNISKDDLAEDGYEEQTHVTALYGLHTNDVEDVRECLEGFKPFTIKLGKVSKFDAPKYDVIKLEVSCPELHKMNKSLKKFPYTSKFPKYVPHCTLAYVKKGSCDSLLGNRSFDGKKVFINKLTFSPSEGSKIVVKLG